MTNNKEKKAPKNTKGNKTKWDFDKIKLEFFASEIDEVKAFFLHQYGTYTGRIKIKTNGWAKGKKEYRQEQIKKAQEAYDEEQIAEWIKVKRNIDKGHKAILQGLAKKAITGNLTVREQIELGKYFKLEKGEETDIIRTQTGESNPLEERLKKMGL